MRIFVELGVVEAAGTAAPFQLTGMRILAKRALKAMRGMP
jgi:hypothetical protein